MVVFLAWVTAFFGGVHVCFVCLCVTKSCINWKMSLYYSANMLNDVSSVKVSKNGWHKNFRVDHRLFPSPFSPPFLKGGYGFLYQLHHDLKLSRYQRCPSDCCSGCVSWLQEGAVAGRGITIRGNAVTGTRQQLCGRQEA